MDSRSAQTTLFARISPEDIILYANAGMASYLGIDKDDLIGTPVESVVAMLEGEMAECFLRRPQTGNVNHLVTDHKGRVFEVTQRKEGGVVDLILNDVTEPEQMVSSYSSSTRVTASELSEEELRGIWQPERRILTVTRTRLCGMNDLAGRLPPTEVRIMLNLFLEEALEGIFAANSSIGDISASEVEGIHGAPRYYRDHPLRALRTIFDQIDSIGKIRNGMLRAGKEIPPLCAGIAAGEVLLSTLSPDGQNRLSVTGPCANLAAKLCRLARPGEVLISQFAFSSLLACLPDDWEFVRVESEEEPDLEGVSTIGEELSTLPEGLHRQVYLVGPGVSDDTERTVFYFSYIYRVQAEGFDTPVPILSVIRPESTGREIALSDDNILTTPVVQVLGKYKLLQVIGQGGMGKVWRGQDRFGNLVAIKVLNAGETANEETVKRFQREAEIMARLPHRNICRVFEIGEAEGVQFIAMEFVEGLTLADLLYEAMDPQGHSLARERELTALIESLRKGREEAESEGRPRLAETSERPRINRILPLEQTLALFGKICGAVQFAHEHGILHRDIKPGNVLLRHDGEPLVADFGLAKLDTDEGASSLSIVGSVVGTLENMAPEQAESSKDVDERADVFSLGTILYQMLTGHRHFAPTGNILADAQTLQTHTPIRPRQWNPSIDADLELICLKALQNHPADRYRSVAALQADLERYRRGELISARPVSALALTRKLINQNRTVSLVAAVAIFLLAGLAVFSFYEINERRLQAENALQAAEEHATRADGALAAAEESRKLAELRQKEAETALEEAQRARRAEKTAARQKDLAVRETEEERAAKTRMEETARNLEEELAALRGQSPDNGAVSEFGQEPEFDPPTDFSDFSPVPPDTQSWGEFSPAREAVRKARIILMGDLAQYELDLLQDTPDVVLERILNGLHYCSAALVSDPSHREALILKGRFHLALHEFSEAQAMFERAAKTSRDAEQIPPRDEYYASLAAQLASWTKAVIKTGSPLEGGRDPLLNIMKETGRPEDEITAQLISFPLFRQQSDGESESPRTLTAGEMVLYLKEKSPEALIESTVEDSSRIVSLRIVGPVPGFGFEALRTYGLETLSLEQMEDLQWQELEPLYLENLKVTDSTFAGYPPNSAPGFAGLLSASFRNTNLSSLGFLSTAVNLESLNLANTEVSDLAPLQSRRLAQLDISGTPISNLLVLSRLPLESLVIDRKLAAESNRIHALRFHRSLRAIRTPEDPEDQPASEFWRKVTRGAYATEVENETSATPVP